MLEVPEVDERERVISVQDIMEMPFKGEVEDKTVLVKLLWTDDTEIESQGTKRE
jgi:methionine-rich copper-binding protein CopC